MKLFLAAVLLMLAGTRTISQQVTVKEKDHHCFIDVFEEVLGIIDLDFASIMAPIQPCCGELNKFLKLAKASSQPWKYQGRRRWYLGWAGLSCDEVCANNGEMCDDNVTQIALADEDRALKVALSSFPEDCYKISTSSEHSLFSQLFPAILNIEGRMA
uniref:Uncharacterized protein n=1 Tax=Hanusia phi TaxID=3032 RepID=A0A7S0I4L6_9CRYP|mmetsp:Transcript_9845/g.22493  ORF Transcript_9845/g.22493 Transcript_9845/m.22493 type:complete len:158 (+) Transcript_9845:143-616(+)